MSTNQSSNPLAIMIPSEIAQFLADCRTLIAHSRTLYEVRDALAKAVWLIESNMRPDETQPVASESLNPGVVVLQIRHNVETAKALNSPFACVAQDVATFAADSIEQMQEEIRRYKAWAAACDEGPPSETTDVTRMRNTLVQSGYTDCGGELWKPPLGRRPVFLDENLRLLDLVARMLPYVQQSEPADFADIEAATAIGREATEALATIRPEEPYGSNAICVLCDQPWSKHEPFIQSQRNEKFFFDPRSTTCCPPERKGSAQKASGTRLVEQRNGFKDGSTVPEQPAAPPSDKCEHGIPRQFCTAVHAEKTSPSLPPCECLLIAKEPSAYHALKCPRFVADKL